ncbi:MAG: hypothetical protein R3E56_05525 [Burkholderiaceae bacterium]
MPATTTFCEALQALNQGAEEDAVRALFPTIELRLKFTYDPAQPQLGPLGPRVIDLIQHAPMHWWWFMNSRTGSLRASTPA